MPEASLSTTASGFKVRDHHQSRSFLTSPGIDLRRLPTRSGEHRGRWSNVALFDRNYASLSDVAVDASGNAYISGYTKGNLFGPAPVLENAFISKYDSAGYRLWAYQFGPGNEDGRAISTDGSGNVYVAGQTHGDFGPANAGHYDNFVIKYNTNVSLLWTKQWGSPTGT
jgi:hypothetical protein